MRGRRGAHHRNGETFTVENGLAPALPGCALTTFAVPAALAATMIAGACPLRGSRGCRVTSRVSRRRKKIVDTVFPFFLVLAPPENDRLRLVVSFDSNGPSAAKAPS